MSFSLKQDGSDRKGCEYKQGSSQVLLEAFPTIINLGDTLKTILFQLESERVKNLIYFLIRILCLIQQVWGIFVQAATEQTVTLDL